MDALRTSEAGAATDAPDVFVAFTATPQLYTQLLAQRKVGDGVQAPALAAALGLADVLSRAKVRPANMVALQMPLV